MIPDKVLFTDHEVDPRTVLTPRKLFNRPIPAEWTRHQFMVPDGYRLNLSLRTLDQWIETNLVGRWASSSLYTDEGDIFIVVHFERQNDAVMFRLRDGEKWYEENS